MTLPMHADHPLIIHLPLIAFAAAIIFDVVDSWSAEARFRHAAHVLYAF